MPRRPMKKRAYRKKTTTVSKPMKQAIVRAIKQAAPQEVKFTTIWNGSSSTPDVYGVPFNAAIGTGTNYAILPTIAQGDGVGQRIGNKINPKRLVVNVWVNPRNFGSSADFVARIFCLESKNFKSALDINTVSMSQLLDYGQTQGSFDGYPLQLTAGVDRTQFKVYSDKLIKMNKAQGVGPTLTNLYDGVVVAPTQNTLHHYRFTIKCPKVLEYDGALATSPVGFAPFLNAGYAILAQDAPDTPDITNLRLQVAWSATLYFTDA